MQNDLSKKMNQAAKWSTVAEIGSKLATPVTNAILARLLVPEAFGVVATLTMVITFAEIFTDAGFQKYLIQHEFQDEEDLNFSTDVAYWSNLVFSLAAWGLIALFAGPIAFLVGSEGHELAIIIISAQIPLLAISSIQMARFRREFDFKTLFFVRMGVSLIPLLITVPLAFYYRSYWALVAGTLIMEAFRAVILTVRSKWKPSFRFRFSRLKGMVSFSMWSVVENVTIWFSTNAGTFIISSIMGAYYLGLFKTTVNTVTGCFNIIQGAILPVLFSALSRCQDDEKVYQTVFFEFQRKVAALVFPLGFGIYVYRELGTLILLGSQWGETAQLFGLRSLMQAFLIVFSYFNSEAFRSRGRPKLSALAQGIEIVVAVPLIYWSAGQNYDTMVVCSTLARFMLIAATSAIAYFALRIRFLVVLKNVWPSLTSAIVMAVFGSLIRTVFPGILWQFFTVGLCVIVYGICMYCIPAGRRQLAELPIINKLLRLA